MWKMKMSGKAWTCVAIAGVIGMVAIVICAVGITISKDASGPFTEREAVIGMVAEGCISPDVYPPQFTGATFLRQTGRDTWFLKDDKYLLYTSLPVPDRSKEKLDLRVRPIVSSPGKQVVITEFVAANSQLRDEDGETSDWIELQNREEKPINLEGWSLSDDPRKPQKWVFPAYILEPNMYLVVYASGKNRVSGLSLHTNFKLKSEGEHIALRRPDGSVASALEHTYPQQMPNVAYGIPFDPSITHFTYLAEPTPGKPNTDVKDTGPLISKVQHRSKGDMAPAGEDLVVDVVMSPHSDDPECVTLVYRVMYGPESHIPMSRSGTSGFTATIPAAEFAAGNMVRWYVKATDMKGRSVRDPPFPGAEWPEFHGTLIFDPSLTSTLPSLHWFTNDPDNAVKNGARGSVFFNGRFYDNVFTRRRGRSALNWDKPKIKFDFKGNTFEYKKNKLVEEFNLQSFAGEKGEISYMKEPVALQILREAGVKAPDSMYLTVNQNGEYYGMFAFVEQMDKNFLEENGYSTNGPMFKAVHWMSSNLRYDATTENLKTFFRKANRKNIDDWDLLHDLSVGLGGGGPIPRSKFIFDELNLPEIINNMAVNTMFLNQDRCTKNYYMYLNPEDSRWTMLPWDLDGAFGISHKLGGQPVKDYCILNCEQFSSPLFCDSEHPQDVELWGNQRKLLISEPSNMPTYRIPSQEEYDRDQTGTPSLQSKAGSYNYLYDALLDWPVTREMYLRRLRTLTDEWMNGKVQDMFSDLWSKIRTEAFRDNQKWQLSSDPDNGLKQLLTHQIPTRKTQLLETYGPGGSGLVPTSQPAAPPMSIKSVEGEYVEIKNPNSFAVDMSNWMIAGDTYYKLPPGTVAASDSSIYVTPDIKGFYRRRTSPKGGEGVLVLGPSQPITGESVILYTDQSLPIQGL